MRGWRFHPGLWRKIGKFIRSTWAVWVGLAVVVLASWWLALHWIPGWYRPAYLTDKEIHAVRARAMVLADHIGDQIIAGRPFVLELDERDMNDILAALSNIWPEAAAGWPQAVQRPMLTFSPGRLRVGFEYVPGENRGIVTADMAIAPSPDVAALMIRLDRAALGAVPVPRRVVLGELDPWLERMQAANQTRRTTGGEVGAPTREDLSPLIRDGIEISNLFTWPNGRRRFRVTSIEFSEGMCRLGIEPL